MADDAEQDPLLDDPSRPSKSARKRDSLARRELGKTLADLSSVQLDAIPLPEHVRAAVDDLQRLTAHGARRRQLLYLGGLLRDIDPSEIQAAVDAVLSSSIAAKTEQHQLERWRERLTTDAEALTEYLAAHPETDRQQLRSLLTRLKKAPPESIAHRTLYRDLFRFLRDNQPA